MIKKLKAFSRIALLLLSSQHVYAGGPLILEGPNGDTPVSYQNPDITVHVEAGNLSSTVSNAEANTILQQAFNLWNGVNSSTIRLNINTTAITEDINLSNFDKYIPNINGSIFNANDNLNPIVYDNNGAIIDAFFGVGASNDTVGFAASIFTVGGRYFSEGYAVISGKPLSPPLSPIEFKLLIAHEIGHFFGIDHTQININNQESDTKQPPICTTNTANNYPVMYPFICRDIESLHADDISAVSALYPAANINNLFGIVQGHFVDSSGNAVLGANIWAENITTGEAISCASDYLQQGTGFYKFYLPPGNYTLHANSINTLFNGGSGIGPYATSILDASFQSPHPLNPEVTYQGLTPGTATVVTVDANQTYTIDFSITGNEVTISNSGGSTGMISYPTIISLMILLLFIRRTDFTAMTKSWFPPTLKWQ